MIEVPKVSEWSEDQCKFFKKLVEHLEVPEGLPDVHLEIRTWLKGLIVDYHSFDFDRIQQHFLDEMIKEMTKKMDEEIFMSLVGMVPQKTQGLNFPRR